VKLRRAVGLGAGATGAAGLLYLLQREAARRWRVGADEVAAAGLSLPPDLRHHFVTTSDGGRIHVVERGEGPTSVLVHGITLGIATWAPQLRALDGRVVAMSQRGHGQSRAGTEGYTFERLAGDLTEVLAELDVRDAVLVGHSMGAMIAQLLASSRPDELARRVRRLVLVATSAGPIVASPLAPFVTAVGKRALSGAERRGQGPLPKSATVWASRLAFGVSPSPADVELLGAMLDAMSPGALAGLLPHLLTFDVRDRLGSIALPVHVVVGTRDLLTPPRTARAIVERVPQAGLTVLPGCGHMVMLERAGTLCDLIAH
jgi:non-heme chloroperoxidase